MTAQQHGLASGPRTGVACWLLLAASVSAADAASFWSSTGHFGEGYRLAWSVLPGRFWASLFAAWAVCAAAAGVRLLTRRTVSNRLLCAGVWVWCAALAVFAAALFDSAGWQGATGATKWASLSASGLFVSLISLHNEALPNRVVQVFEILAEDFELTERSQ
jgi:hypothetical protein